VYGVSSSPHTSPSLLRMACKLSWHVDSHRAMIARVMSMYTPRIAQLFGEG
jgi:hypothetical protein